MTIKRTDSTPINPSEISTVFEGRVDKPQTGPSTSTTSPAGRTDDFATHAKANQPWDFAVSRLTGSLFTPQTPAKTQASRDTDFPSMLSTILQPDQKIFDLFNDVLDSGMLTGAEQLAGDVTASARTAVEELRAVAPEIVRDISGGFGNLFIDILAAGERLAGGKSEIDS